MLVQVVDTGFDDASCWLRDTGFIAASALRQVDRSSWDAPITNTSLRKVVQYVSVNMRNSSSTPGVYGYDYAAGHGTHVASTVCGSLDPGDGSSFDGTSLDAFSADELDCSAYLSLCSVLFCTSCDFAHYCDATCGYAFAAGNASVYSGMAPDAQVLGYDVGDAAAWTSRATFTAWCLRPPTKAARGCTPTRGAIPATTTTRRNV
jgi:hypothetical protein